MVVNSTHCGLVSKVSLAKVILEFENRVLPRWKWVLHKICDGYCSILQWTACWWWFYNHTAGYFFYQYAIILSLTGTDTYKIWKRVAIFGMIITILTVIVCAIKVTVAFYAKENKAKAEWELGMFIGVVLLTFCCCVISWNYPPPCVCW